MQVEKTILAALLLGGSTASAANDWYLAASAGIMDADVGGYDSAANAGILAGYNVYRKDLFAASMEAEFTTTLSDGDVEFRGNHGDWDIDTQAAYLAFTLGEEFYVKARFGLSRVDVSTSISGASRSGSDSGGSWGGAIGWLFGGNWGIQADGTLVDSDVTYWNLGLLYHF